MKDLGNQNYIHNSCLFFVFFSVCIKYLMLGVLESYLYTCLDEQ